MSNPPLTSVDEYPLHPQGIYDDAHVWACSSPERPRDDHTGYDWRCRDCVTLAEAHIAIHGDEQLWWTATGGAEPVLVSQSWMVARSRWWWNGAGRVARQ